MSAKDSQATYGFVTKVLHWSIAILVILQFVWIYWRDSLPKGHHLKTWLLLSLHKPLGMLVLFLGLLFIAWRLINIQPGMPGHTARWELIAARSVQGFLFLMMLAMPISGYLMSAASGYSVKWFGLAFPLLIEKNRSLAGLYHDSHHYLGYFLMACFVLHAAAALKHHFMDRDHLLRRMLPFADPRP
jgi:superoxide oxidase